MYLLHPLDLTCIWIHPLLPRAALPSAHPGPQHFRHPPGEEAERTTCRTGSDLSTGLPIRTNRNEVTTLRTTLKGNRKLEERNSNGLQPNGDGLQPNGDDPQPTVRITLKWEDIQCSSSAASRRVKAGSGPMRAG